MLHWLWLLFCSWLLFCLWQDVIAVAAVLGMVLLEPSMLLQCVVMLFCLLSLPGSSLLAQHCTGMQTAFYGRSLDLCTRAALAYCVSP